MNYFSLNMDLISDLISLILSRIAVTWIMVASKTDLSSLMASIFYIDHPLLSPMSYTYDLILEAYSCSQYAGYIAL